VAEYPVVLLSRRHAALRRGALRAALWLEAPLARARQLDAPSRLAKPAHPAFGLSGVDRNPSRALRVAYGDGLRPLPTEPGRESPVVGSYRGWARSGTASWRRGYRPELAERNRQIPARPGQRRSGAECRDPERSQGPMGAGYPYSRTSAACLVPAVRRNVRAGGGAWHLADRGAN